MTAGAVIGATLLPIGASSAAAAVACWDNGDKPMSATFTVIAVAAIVLTFIVGVVAD